MHTKLWRPSRLTRLPEWHLWGRHMSKPNLRPTATQTARCPGQGRTLQSGARLASRPNGAAGHDQPGPVDRASGAQADVHPSLSINVSVPNALSDKHDANICWQGVQTRHQQVRQMLVPRCCALRENGGLKLEMPSKLKKPAKRLYECQAPPPSAKRSAACSHWVSLREQLTIVSRSDRISPSIVLRVGWSKQGEHRRRIIMAQP